MVKKTREVVIECSDLPKLYEGFKDFDSKLSTLSPREQQLMMALRMCERAMNYQHGLLNKHVETSEPELMEDLITMLGEATNPALRLARGVMFEINGGNFCGCGEAGCPAE